MRPRNPVAKFSARLNRAKIQADRKRAAKAGYRKHRGQDGLIFPCFMLILVVMSLQGLCYALSVGALLDYVGPLLAWEPVLHLLLIAMNTLFVMANLRLLGKAISG